MSNDAVSQVPSTPAWRTEVLGFLMLFFGIAAIDALSELHKIGHPFGNLLFRALVTASIIAIALHIIGGRRTR
jgi:hypothetical protein